MSYKQMTLSEFKKFTKSFLDRNTLCLYEQYKTMRKTYDKFPLSFYMCVRAHCGESVRISQINIERINDQEEN